VPGALKQVQENETHLQENNMHEQEISLRLVSSMNFKGKNSRYQGMIVVYIKRNKFKR
jgi:hypothetical protein